MANLKDLIVNGSARVIGKLFAQTPNEPTNNNEVATTAFVKNNTVTKTLDGTSKKTWIGTSAKYETDKASGLITNTTECIITDDEQELTLGVDTYTKDEIDDKIKSSYYVGQTIFSLDPLNYASLRLLDGSLLQVGGVYDEFISKYIEPLFKKHPNRFVTEAEWQEAVKTYGVCGKYVYTEGVAVRLPKVTGIVEGTIDPSALGDLVEAGLPAHTHTRGTMNITGCYGAEFDKENIGRINGAFYATEVGSAGWGNESENGYTAYMDASRSWTGSTSNPNYTKNIKTTNTVQPQTIKGYYYIVVATGIDEEVNLKFDTLDVDYARSDLSNLTEQGKKHFVGKDNITNCLLEVPQNIKLELKNGNLTLKAGSKVIVPNGFEANGTTPKFDEMIVTTDRILTPTVNKNGTVMMYLTGSKQNIDYMEISANFSSATQPNIGSRTYAKWYDTTENKLKWTSDGGSTWGGGYSFPICIFKTSDTANADGRFDTVSIDQVFNGFGCIGSHIWVDKGVKVLVANGINDDGTIKNEEIVNPRVLLSSNSAADGGIPFFRLHKTAKTPQIYVILEKHFLGELDYVPTLDTTLFQWYLNTNEMKWYMHDVNETQWVSTPYYNISPPVTVANNIITSFKPYKPFRAVGYNEIQSLMTSSGGEGGGGVAFIVETSGNSTKGYRLWSDGYCEQWGQLSSTASGAGTATLAKPYKDNNYILVAQSATTAAKDSSGLGGLNTSIYSQVAIFAKSTSSISLAAHCGGQFELLGAATILYHTFGYVS